MAPPIKKHEVQFIITAKDTASKVFKGIQGVLPSLGTVAKASGVAVAAIGAAAIAAVADFANFETAVVDLGRVTGQNLGEMKKKILDLPPELGKTTDLARGLYNVISSGVTDPVKSFEFLTTAAKGAKVAHVDINTVVSALSDTMDGFGGKIKDATDASDLLFKIEAVGKTRFEQLVPVIGQVTTSANLLGASVEDLGGLFATVSKTSGGTAQAATGLKAIFAGMITPSGELTKVLKKLKIETAETGVKSLGLSGFLQKLKGEVDSGKTSWNKLFTSQEALLALGPSINDNFKTLTKNIGEMGNRSGATQSAFDLFSKTIEGSFGTLIASADRVLKEVVGIFAPEISKAMRDLSATITANRPAIVAFAESIKIKFSEAFKVIDDTLQGKETVITSFFNSTSLSFDKLVTSADGVSTAIVSITPLLEDIAEFIDKVFIPAIKASIETLATVGGISGDIIKVAIAEIEATATKVAIAMNDLGGQAAEAYLSSLAQNIADHSQFMTQQSLNSVIKAFQEEIEKKDLAPARVFGEKFAATMAAGIRAKAPEIKKETSDAVKQANEELKKFAEKAKTAGTETMKNYAEAIKQQEPATKTAAKSATDFSQVWKDNQTAAKEGGKIYTEEIGKALQEGASIIESGGLSAVVWPKDKAPKEMESAGKMSGANFSQGIQQGFDSESYQTELELERISREIFNKYGVNVQSQAQDSGEKTAKGVAEGLELGTPIIIKATEDLALGVMELLPHKSPADKGPLSKLDRVGPALIDTIAKGVTETAGNLSDAVIKAFDVVFKEIDKISQAVENIPDVDIDTQQAINNLQSLSRSISILPDQKIIAIHVDNGQALGAIAEVKRKLDDIPDVTRKSLIIQAKTQASPIMDFTKGVNYMGDRLDKLVTPRDLLIRADVPSRLSQADPRFTDVARPRAQVKQDVKINVNVRVDKLDAGRHTIDLIAADIGNKIARDINNNKGDMPKAIRNIAVRV